MERRGILKTLLAGVAGVWGAQFASPERAAAQTKHIRLYVEMDEAVKHEGYIRVKMLKRRAVIQGNVPPAHNYRFELEFESEELRQKWIASAAHQRVWPPVEKTMTTTKDYPVVLYDEV